MNNVKPAPPRIQRWLNSLETAGNRLPNPVLLFIYFCIAILVFSALKGVFLREEIKKYTIKKNWRLLTDYHFGGYAKVNDDLIQFINSYIDWPYFNL